MSPKQLSLDFAHLRFSPTILQRLGEELNPNPDQGLLELVKNAYDADATKCVIELENIDKTGGTIRVTDDGLGMDEQQIEDGWLVIGRSTKSVSSPTPKFGRLPAGNKGLGRIAALRMGRNVELVTRPESKPKSQFRLSIDWDSLDAANVVEDVQLEIQPGKRRQRGHGTDISIIGLRARLTRNDVKRLARGILLLADPFQDDPSAFNPILKAPEFEDLERLVQARYFDDAEFHLTAEVNEQGMASARVVDWKQKLLYDASHADLRAKAGESPYACPPAHFDLWVFILDAKTFSTRTTTLGEVRDWLREFGGVHLYLRGLRVAPYGESGNDWLDMNLSRVRSPEHRPGTNTSIGRVTLDDKDEALLQKTDRSGLVENDAFRALQQVAIDAMDWMAKRRIEERDRRQAAERMQAQTRSKSSRDTVEDAIDRIEGATTDSKEHARRAFEKFQKAAVREVQTLRREVQLYRTLSTAGITAAVFAHESKQPAALIKRNAATIQRIGQQKLKSEYDGTLGGPVTRIQRQADALQAFSSLTLSQVDHEKRRAGRVEVHKVINDVLAMFKPFVETRRVDVVAHLDTGNPFLRASQAAVESIVTNLLTNSLKAIEASAPGKHCVEFSTELSSETIILRCRDTGPGIQGIGLKDIWLAGESTYPNGTGLGLTIVRDTASDLGGTVDAAKTSELGGAEIVIEIPILGV